MSDLFFDPHELSGGEIAWNLLKLNFQPEDEEFDWSVLYVRYPNGCALEVMWHGQSSNQRVGFHITLVHTDGKWIPYKQDYCPRIEMLRGVVGRLASETSGN